MPSKSIPRPEDFFKLRKNINGKYYWVFRNPGNSTTMLQSWGKGYSTKQAAEKALNEDYRDNFIAYLQTIGYVVTPVNPVAEKPPETSLEKKLKAASEKV